MLSRNLTLPAFLRAAILAYKTRGVRLQTSRSINSKGEENGICELNKHKNISFEDIKLVDQLESTFSMLFIIKVIMNTSHHCY